ARYWVWLSCYMLRFPFRFPVVLAVLRLFVVIQFLNPDGSQSSLPVPAPSLTLLHPTPADSRCLLAVITVTCVSTLTQLRHNRFEAFHCGFEVVDYITSKNIGVW